MSYIHGDTSPAQGGKDSLFVETGKCSMIR